MHAAIKSIPAYAEPKNKAKPALSPPTDKLKNRIIPQEIQGKIMVMTMRYDECRNFIFLRNILFDHLCHQHIIHITTIGTFHELLFYAVRLETQMLIHALCLWVLRIG